MLRRTILALAVAALTLPAGALAQEHATIMLRSGEKLNAELMDLGGVGFTVRVNGQERRIPAGDVAVIDFTGGEMTDADWAKFSGGTNVVVLKSGQTITGQLYDISGSAPLKITFKTDSGDRELSSSDIGRIILARPNANVVATSGAAAQVPGGQGIAVPANQAWTPTGLKVRRGEVLTFTATGEARLSSDSSDVASPAGAMSQRTAQSAPLPRVFAGALIARVGNGEPFPIGGPTSTVTMPANGELFLGINDDDVNDNQGGFRVNIQRTNRRR